jgi:DNA-binding CsgD family transcriptional regulator
VGGGRRGRRLVDGPSGEGLAAADEGHARQRDVPGEPNEPHARYHDENVRPHAQRRARTCATGLSPGDECRASRENRRREIGTARAHRSAGPMARRGPDPALHRLRSAALDAAMRCIDVPAYLFDAAGAELARNPAGAELLGRDRAAKARLAEIARGAGSDDWDAHAVGPRDATRAVLVVRRRGHPLDADARVAHVVEHWSLTSRQADVLRLVLEGASNKQVAARLRIANGTAELHVSALLRKAGVGSRAELLTRFWGWP